MTLQQFLATSYTSYHATANVKKILDDNDYKELTLSSFDVDRGGKYYIINNNSSIIAFVIGGSDRFLLAMSHTDSPCLHIKGDKLVEGNGVVRANVEMYGGALRYTFMDRQLKIAGRLLVEQGNSIVSQLASSDYNVVIPSVAIHHNPKANDGFAINAQVDMLPLIGLAGDSICSTLTKDNVVDADLYVVPASESYYAGANNELLCSARIDNLTSVYTSIMALIDSQPQGIAMCCCYDNEEIGNATKQGADSSWTRDVVGGIATCLGMDSMQLASALNSGFGLSIDNGHAVHPAHPEKYDITERVYMGGGVVIKHNTRYATDGMSSAILKKVLSDNGLDYQDYYNRSDLPSGGTLGLTVATMLNMNVVDIGIAQLAMHSACETICMKDIDTMTSAVKSVFDSNMVVGQSLVKY